MYALLRQSLRAWKAAKGVAILAITALAVGLGSATAIYSVVNAVLIRPLPYAHGERFVSLFGAQMGEPGVSSVSWLNLLEFERRMRSFDAFGIYQPNPMSMTAPGRPRQLKTVEVSPGFVPSLGVNPMLGRWFGNDGNVYQAVISDGLWKALGAPASIVGQRLTLDAQKYVITGVMPGWFRFPASDTSGGEFRTDVWMPLNPRGSNRNRDVYSYFAYARLSPGVTVAQADADGKRVAADLVRLGYVNPKFTAVVTSVLEYAVKDIRPTLLLLAAAALALLLITCANVAGLFLARAVARVRETGIRVAMGATRGQLALQYFSEGILVAICGAVLGVFVSMGMLRFVLSIAADYIPRADDIGVDWRALAFAGGVAIAASVLFSFAPLWQAMRTQPNEVLSDGTRSSAGARSRHLSRVLVIAEIMLAFTLLSTGAILVAHLTGLLHVNPGFNVDGLVVFDANLNFAELPSREQRNQYRTRLTDAIRAIPGVRGVSYANQIPLNGCCFYIGLSPDWRVPDPAGDRFDYISIGPDYFQTMGIGLVKGRFLGESDQGETVLNIVINQTAAERFWPGREPVGQMAHFPAPNTPPVRVVGVIRDIRDDKLSAPAKAEAYFPAAVVGLNPVHVVVRSALGQEVLMSRIYKAVEAVNPTQAIVSPRTMHDVVLGSVMAQRLQSFLTGFFSLAALLMAALGVYGVVSYAVRHRTVEIGTRMAVGATGSDVLRMVIGDGFGMAGWGVAAGAIAVTASALLLRSKIFGIDVGDPRPFLISTGVVIGFTAVACAFPAWRATLVTPMVAIREDAMGLRRQNRRRIGAAAVPEIEDFDAVEGELLSEFLAAGSQAGSFPEAIELSLARVREMAGADSAVLLEKRGDVFESASLRIPVAGLLAGRLRFFAFPLPLAQEDFDAWQRGTSGHAEEIESLRASGAAIAVPLLANREINGILLLGAHRGGVVYSHSEKRLLRSCAAQFALMLANARLTDRMLEQEKLRRDVQLAIEVQKRLFPDQPPATAELALAGMSLAARSVGGDYYDFFDLGDGRIGVALADVAGKGIAAALIMSVVQASLRILAADRETPLSVLASRMNHYLHRATRANAYATFFYAQIDSRNRQLRYVNAGHNPPCLLRYVSPKEIEELPAGGTVIGLFPQESYEEAVVDLATGDVLMVFTDGVPEALNPAEEEFGEDRLKELLRRVAHLSVDEMASAMLGELKAWIADAAQYDDLTFVLVKVS